MSIDALKGLITRNGGIARQNLYQVTMPVLGNDPRLTLPSELNLLCDDANIPGRNIDTTGHTIGVLTRQMPTAFSPAPGQLMMSFILLNDYGAKRYFETWQDSVLSKDTYEVGYMNDYVRDFNIFQLNKEVTSGYDATTRREIINDVQNNQIINFEQRSYVYGVKIQNAYPKTIQPVQLNNTSTEASMKLMVEFTYTDWIEI